MVQIHWVGTGLSSVPGLRKLIKTGHDVFVWNRTVEVARNAVGDITENIKEFTIDDLKNHVSAGDIVVSMLPGEWHVKLAKLCISADAHFVSSSYIAQDMRDLHDVSQAKGLVLMNEVGLDPGIDHSMAHWLMADYKRSDVFDIKNDISFVSYCGGIPKNPNPFRYKFSWAPLGVLKALRSPSRSISEFKTLDVARPWDAVSNFKAPLPIPETFEVYPNRDSLPFMAEYGVDDNWSVKQFVRGTLRLSGWADAWGDVFEEVERLDGADGNRRLQALSDELLEQNRYAQGEPDRVVMFVSLKAETDQCVVYNKTYAMDAYGDADFSAMSQLVSIPVSLAVEAVLAGEITTGVSAAPSDPMLVDRWMTTVAGIAQHLEIVNHLE